MTIAAPPGARRVGRPRKGEVRPKKVIAEEAVHRYEAGRQRACFEEACRRRDFAAALEALSRFFDATGELLRCECEDAGLPHWAGFWHGCAREAERALHLYKDAGPEGAEVLRKAGLVVYAEALATGDYCGLVW